jgi:large subunit ribosomal protein L29
MKAKEIREMNKEEVKKILTDKRNRLLKLRFDISSKQIKNNREYRNIKKDIARILTVFKESKI